MTNDDGVHNSMPIAESATLGTLYSSKAIGRETAPPEVSTRSSPVERPIVGLHPMAPSSKYGSLTEMTRVEIRYNSPIGVAGF